MQRVKKVYLYWFAQIGGWSLLSTLIFLASISDRENSMPPVGHTVFHLALFFCFGMTLSHGMRFLFIRWNWLNMRLGPLVPRVLLMSVCMALVMSLITLILNVMLSEILFASLRPFRLPNFLLEICTRSIFFLLWNCMYFSFHFFQQSRAQEVKNLQLSASQNEIELKNLRSQLNPHFLFNSLNSIRALIDLDPDQAKNNITTLSNLLRKSLILGKNRLVSLKDELDMVNDYLDLEKVRFEERLTIKIEHDEQLDELPVPPFIIQTLVENAFKHGISKLIEGGKIIISSSISENQVRIVVSNDGKLGNSVEVDTGIGLQNTLRRLQLQYGPKAKFSLKQSGQKVEALIELTQPI